MEESVEYCEHGVRVGPADFGLGVFSLRAFAAQEVIGPIVGQIYDGVDYESDYCMALGVASALEPDAPFRFLNHSCRPNCSLLEFEIEYDDGTDGSELWLSAEKDIESGEQMTIDYGWPAESAIPCGCGSSECRKWIVAADELSRVATGASSHA
jgi:uncharacterized protein